MILCFSEKRVDKIGTPKRTSDDGGDLCAIRSAHLDVVADVEKNVMVTKAVQSKLGPVAMSGEVLERMECLAEEAVGFIQLCVLSRITCATTGLDDADESAADEAGAGAPSAALVG